MNDEIFREEQINNSIYEHDRRRIRVNVTNNSDDPIPVAPAISIAELLQIAISSGIIAGESYDEVVGGDGSDTHWLLEFLFEEISQFQVLIDLNYPLNFKVKKRPSQFPMLQENGDFLLQENGDKILVQGLIP